MPELIENKTITPVASLESRPAGKRNIASLEGLRALAALGVVTLHITYLVGQIIIDQRKYPWLAFFWVFGNTGVQLFFVLSGFLLFMPYARALLFQERWPSARTFYFRRVLRILPGYYFSLFLLIIFVQPIYLHPDHWAQLFLFLTFFMDTSKVTFEHIDVPYWTLAIEVQFYLFLPLVAFGIHALVQYTARTPRRRLLMAIVACLLLMIYGLIVRFIGLQLPQASSTLPDNLLAGVQFLLFGMQGKFWEDFAVGMLVSLCFIYAQHPEQGRAWPDNLKKISPLLGLGALALITFCALWNFRISYPIPQFHFFQPFVVYGPLFLTFVVSLGWGLLIMSILTGYSWFSTPFAWKPVRWLGTASYAIYIWHFPMLTVFKKYAFSHLHITNVALSHLAYWSFFLLVILPWCALVYWFIERPFIRLKDRHKSMNF